jgi:hypothetical protein
MARYKISKENINEFFGLFGKKAKPKDRAAIQALIDADPRLQAINKEIDRLNKVADKRIESDPWKIAFLKKHGIDLKKIK